MGRDYLDPNVTAVNRLPARARRFLKSRTLSLNGEWRFRLFARPEDCGDFFSPEAGAGYAPIRVPANWQVEGFGEPIYTNYAYPWPLGGALGVDGMPDPFRVPEDNPTGCYRKWFELPEDMAGELILRFDGVETAYELYVNGAYVGYAEDSKLTSEFDATGFLRPGKNLVALRVFTYATSSYLEDQDYWYLCGIHRGVTLIAAPRARMEDFVVRAVADRHLPGGVLTADVKVSRVPGFQNLRAKARLLDAAGDVVAEGEANVAARAEYSQLIRPTANTARIAIPLEAVERWSPEKPYLYTVEFSLLDADGNAIDADECRVGFKRVDIENGILLVNGKRLLVFGVNRHEHAWKFGRAVPREHMIEEIRSMKRMNVNAVRTCHYPDSPEWYELCDEMGLFVLCECDVETHGVAGQITHDSQWAGMFVERAERMVKQHRNHASIYGWSLGNESGFGPNHAAMYGLVKELDPTRLCQYEAGNPGPHISDTRGSMYATEKQIMALLTDPRDDRPVILVEYLYQIRNSGGGMKKFIELTRRYERFQGGYVWDWQDKALLGKTEDGREFFAHGGDFGESFIEPHEPPYMTNNGLVRADLEWKPVAYDVREAYAPILIEEPYPDHAWVARMGKGRYAVTNRTLSLHSREFAAELLAVDGTGAEVLRAPIALPELAPGESGMIDLNEAVAGCADVPTLYLEFTVTRIATGEEVAHRQFAWRKAIAALPDAHTHAPDLREAENLLILSGAGFEAAFSREDGALVRFVKNGATLASGGGICHDRPYTGLDAREGWGWRAAMDEARALKLATAPVRVLRGEGEIALKCAFSDEHSRLRGELTWTVRGDGTIRCALDAQAAEGLMPPRIGLELTIPEGFEDAEYLGYGPHENYSDRMVAARFGRYASTVDGLGFDFAPPSENGGREGAIELILESASGARFTVRAEQPFHFDARHATVADLQSAMHTHDLTRRPEITLHLDAWHAPIGGDMAWSTALDRSQPLGAGKHSLRVTLG